MKSFGRDRLSRLERLVWDPRGDTLGPWKTRGLRVVRTALALARDLSGGQLTLRAMSLVYTTLLSSVPLLALSFSVLKAFGVHNQIEPMLLNFLAPLGGNGEEVTRRIVEFVENMNVGVLGALGLALLLYTAISLMQKIEESLNFIWHIPRARPLTERFSRYLSVLLVGPILIFSALGITATMINIQTVREVFAIDALGYAARGISQLMPYMLMILAFTFVYMFIPNTKVRVWPALAGGAVGGIAWQSAGSAFAVFVASSNQYAAIYSSFAVLLLFMVWLYLSWLILLVGASVAFYAQHPEYLFAKGGEPRLSNRMRERLALSATTLVAQRFIAGERAPSLADFTRALLVPMHALKVVLDALEGRGLIAQSADHPALYLPGRDPSLISVSQVLDAVRAAGEERFLAPDAMPVPQGVDQLLGEIEQAVDASVGETTLRDIASRNDKGLRSHAGP